MRTKRDQYLLDVLDVVAPVISCHLDELHTVEDDGLLDDIRRQWEWLIRAFLNAEDDNGDERVTELLDQQADELRERYGV